MQISVVNVTSGGTATFQMEASQDGRTWFDLGSSKQMTAFGAGEVAQGSVDAAYIRVGVSFSGFGTEEVVFDATLAFSHQ